MEDKVISPVILITGATGGIGSVIARQLHKNSFQVILSGRCSEKLAALGKELNAPGLLADVTKPDQVEQLIKDTVAVHGRIDGIIHAVGSMLLKPAHITTLEEFHATIELNLYSAFYLLKYGVREMNKGSSFVFFSTVATGIGLANHEAIASAKAGIDGLVISSAATYAGKGIRVNAVAPGLTRTNLSERITNNEAALKASTSMIPLGAIGEPDDVASAAAWLVDPAQKWVTGQIIRVDGGMSTVRAR
jgi:3-oxoacyl-[acyl-carrier protein] reductase